MVNSAEFLIGYANHEQYLIENSTEQICAFIMKFRNIDVTITDFLDGLELTTSMGFIFYCRNQDYLREKLIPALAPMQMGEVAAPEFKPYSLEEELELEE
jgi:hypothetical protein